MDGNVGSFRVHLQSLKDFADRLQGQLQAVRHPGHAFDVLHRPPELPLGGFAEAFSLSDAHSDAIGHFANLVDRVARSLEFTGSVTSLVAQRYEALNAGGAQNFGALVNAPAPPLPATGTAAPPAGSVAPPDVLARFTVPVPPAGGTVYYYNGSTTVPVGVTVQAPDP